MLRLFSPAKINLFLRIVSKRADGYHDLSSVFQTISLGDTLTIESHPKFDVLTCSDLSLPLDSTNLILKATELFRRKTDNQEFYKIHLTKRIPTQAGLGGGSSNAATALWACQQLSRKEIALDTLKQWGSEIGSDVPFFFSQGTAYCTGRGESVYHLPALKKRSLWIVKPPEGLSTPAVYRQLNFNSTIANQTIRRDLEFFLSGSSTYFNDLEKPAFEIQPALKNLKNLLLEKNFEVVLMSGSGSSFFCLGDEDISSLPNLKLYQAQYLNRSLSQWYQDPSLMN